MARDEVIISATIEQLRTYCAPLEGRVAGAAEYRLGLKDYNTSGTLPFGYVLPLDQVVEPERNLQMTGLQQYIHKTIGIAVEFDATADRRGQDPTRSYDAVEAALFYSLLNWSPVECRVPNRQGYYFAGARFLPDGLDRARLFYQWEFTLVYQITELDGFIPPDGTPLAIEVDLYKAPPFAPLPPADGSPPAAVIKLISEPETVP